MYPDKPYVGIDKDRFGGMSDIGKVIRDAWVFGLIPEHETCAGWELASLEHLWQQVNAEWERYGFRVNALPEAMKQRYLLIHQQAIDRAIQAGWNAESDLEDD